MNLRSVGIDDPLEPLGIAAGAFLLLAGLATVAGAPWTVHASIVSAVIQVVGALLMALVGAGLVFISWTGRE